MDFLVCKFRKATPQIMEVPQKVDVIVLSHPVRVQVSNMPPPWGKCGESDLKYLSVYSVSTCTTECETEYVYKHCSCVDVSMPSGNGQILTVLSAYVNSTNINIGYLVAVYLKYEI